MLRLNCVVSLDVTQPCTRSDAVPLVISAAVRCVYAKFEIKGSFITPSMECKKSFSISDSK